MTIDIRSLAEYLAITQRVIHVWVKKKVIPYRKSGQHLAFDLDKIDAWIEESRYKA